MAFTDRLHNRGSISTGYDVSNSLKFEDATNERLRRNNPNSGQRRTYTVSMWLKRTELGYNRIWGVGISGNDIQAPYFKDTDEIIWYDYGASAYRFNYHTNRKFRDTSAWYHLVFAVDTEQSTEADRVKLYVNGVEETSFSTQTEPSQNADTNWNYQGTWDVGTAVGEDPHFSGYMSEVYFIDDQQLDCTNFGEFDEDSGIWKPKEFSGTFGSNDVYANFDDASSLGADSSGNSNDWTLVNITAADQATDTPTNNFCTLNVIANIENNAVVFTEGATVGSVSGGGNVSDHAMATMGFSSGKWYYEAYVTTGSTNDDAMFGFANTNGWYQGLGNDTYSAGAHQVGRWYYNSNTFTTTGATAWDKGDIVQIAIDCDNGKCWSGVNGTYSSGNPSTNTGGFDWDANVTNMSIGDLVIPVTRVLYTAPGTTYYNFGGYTLIPISSAASDANGYGTFEYAPPTGFHAICTKNLAEYG